MNSIGWEVDWFRRLLNFLPVINRIHSWSDYEENSKMNRYSQDFSRIETFKRCQLTRDFDNSISV